MTSKSRLLLSSAMVLLLVGSWLHADEPSPLPVRAVAFSPDGRWLAACYGDLGAKSGHVSVWDAATRQVRWTHREPVGVPSLAWSSDGQRLAIGLFTDEARVLDAATGQVQVSLPGHGKSARAVAFAPDGKTLFVGTYDKVIKHWDLATRTELRTLEGHKARVYGLSLAADGQSLLSLAEDGVKLWDLAAGKDRQTWNHGPGFATYAALLTRDGRWALTGGGEGAVRIWDTQSGNLHCKFQNLGGVNRLAFHPATRTLAACGMGKIITLLELTLNEPSAQESAQLQRLLTQLDADRYETREAASKEVLALGFIAERTLEQAAREATSVEVRIRARRLRRELLSQPRAVLSESGRHVLSMAFSPDGKVLASGARDGTVRLWDLATRTEAACLMPALDRR